jgi:hypothetical protein
LRSALANRLDDGRIVIWEPGFTVTAFAAGDTVGTPIGRAGPAGQYGYAAAATQLRSDRFRLILVGQQWIAIELNSAGEILRTDTLPDPGALTALGYIGNRLVRQRMHGWMSNAGGHFTVTALSGLTDTIGTTLLDAPLTWLPGGDTNGPPVPPMIASSPSWSLSSNGDVVWSPGSRLVVERRSPSGQVRWRVEGPGGPPVSGEEFAAREAAVRAATVGMPYTDDDYAAMRERSDTLHPAVSGVIVTPTDEVLVARTVFPNRPMVEYLRLDANGLPNGRFTLDRRVRVLLAERDSLLVHTPTEAELWEVRWMRLQ